MTTTREFNAPVNLKDRIVSLDVLRGLAVMGILIMNIQSYSMIGAAYINPTAYGDLTGLNKWIWILNHLFVELKFMTLFSILFGAGIFLFTDRLQSKGDFSLGLHYRRTFWLFIIGMAHAYLLWYGDILVTYAICAIIVVLLRKLAPKILVTIGFIFVLIPSLLYLMFGISWDFMPPEAHDSIKMSWYSSPEFIAKELATYRGGWLEQMEMRIPEAINFQTFIFLIFIGWRAAGLMLIGMALYKWGILSATRSYTFYLISMLIGFGIGLPIIILGVTKNFTANWVVNYSMFFGSQYNYWGSLFISFAYISLCMLLFRWFQNSKIINGFAAVGRMALTNYLIQTIICTFIFYGHGLGYFGSVDRRGQIVIVIIIWLFQLVSSSFWLSRFWFGPAEWLWRSLTYWRKQTFLKIVK